MLKDSTASQTVSRSSVSVLMANGTAPPSIGERWAITLTSLGVTSSSFLFINGVAFLIPALVAVRQTPLAEAALLASMPSWGMVVTLVLWGYLTDRLGERLVMAVGSALTAAAAFGAASAHSLAAMGPSFSRAAWLPGVRTPPEAGWYPDGSHQTGAGWRWESARPRNRSESPGAHP